MSAFRALSLAIVRGFLRDKASLFFALEPVYGILIAWWLFAEQPTLRMLLGGALIVEQIEDAKLREGTLQRVDVVSEHSSGALANAQEHNNLFLMPVWRTIGKASWVVRAKTLPKTLSIAAAVGAVVAVEAALRDRVCCRWSCRVCCRGCCYLCCRLRG